MDNNSQLNNQPKATEAALADTKTINKNKIKRALFLVGGSLALGLALIGIFVPGLPVTPFALLAAALYAKSSEKLYNWLLNNKILGPRIKNYQRNKGVTRKGKIGILAFMITMVLFSSFVVIRGNMTIRYIILFLGLMGVITVWFIVPTAKDDSAKKD